MKLIKGIYFPDSDNHFENVIDDQGNYQRKQFDAVLKYIKPEDRGLFIDVGAHVGLWSLMAVKAGFKSLCCFEPDDENESCLQANLTNKLDVLDNCWVFPYGLSDKRTHGKITNPKSDNSGAKCITEDSRPIGYEDWPILWTFDEHCLVEEKFKNKILIKIDVQGYEAKVVRGMKKFIQEYKPIIIVEQFLNGQPDYEATMILKSYGMKTLESVEKEVILGW